MKKILIILFTLLSFSLIGQVPNTETFSLQDVITEIGGGETSLQQCFDNANVAGFDPTYDNASYAPANSLLRFRNYAHSTVYVDVLEYSSSASNNDADFTITGHLEDVLFEINGSIAYTLSVGSTSITIPQNNDNVKIKTAANIPISITTSNFNWCDAMFYLDAGSNAQGGIVSELIIPNSRMTSFVPYNNVIFSGSSIDFRNHDMALTGSDVDLYVNFVQAIIDSNVTNGTFITKTFDSTISEISTILNTLVTQRQWTVTYL